MSYKFLSTILGIDANFTGSVGVGTTTPAYKLDVAGTAKVSGISYLIGGLLVSNYGSTIAGGQSISGSGAGNYDFNNGSGGGWYFNWIQNGATAMRLSSGNNLLIGTTTDAGYKLDVNGTARIYGASTSSLMIDTVGTADMASSITFRQNSPNWSSSIGTHTSGGGLHYGLQFKSQPSTVNFVINRDGSTYFGGFGLANSSSLVELSSTTKGFLQPRMTTTQRNAIATPATGLSIYNTTTNTEDYYNGSAWVSLQTSITNPVTGTGTTNYLPKWSSSSALSNSLVYDDGTNVGIGTTSPSYKIDVNGTGRVQGSTFRVGDNSNYFEVYTDGSSRKQLRLFSAGNFETTLVSGSGGQLAGYNSGTYSWSLGQNTLSIKTITTNGYPGYNPLTFESYYYPDSTTTPAFVFKNFTTSGSGVTVNRLQLFNGDSGKIVMQETGGNVLIGTTTDAGYKLDVNGTGRVQTSLTIGGAADGTLFFPNTTSGHQMRIYTQYASNAMVIFANGYNLNLNGAGSMTSNFCTTITGSNGSAALTVQQGNVAWTPVLVVNAIGSTGTRFNTNGNVLIGTTTDAGYKLDVNGTARINSTLALTNSTYAGTFSFYLSAANVFQASSSNVGVWLQVGGGNRVYIIGQEFNSTARGNIFGNTVGGEAISATTIIAQSSGTTATTGLSLRYTINNTGTYVGISRGIYYNPTITSLTGTTHRAIETVTGDVIFGSTSGVVGIGTTSLSTEANLYLGAKSTSEGGQLVLQKGTSQTYATHLDNYNDQFRVMVGTNTGSTAAQLIVMHATGNVLINSGTDNGYKLQVAGDVNINTASTTNNLVVNADTSMFYNLTSGGGQVKSNVYTTSKTTRYYVPPLSTEFLFEWDPTLCQGIFVDYVLMIVGLNYIRSGTLVIANDNGGNVTITDNINSSVNGSSTAFVTFSTAGLASIKLGCDNLLAANDVYVNIVTRYIPNIY